MSSLALALVVAAVAGTQLARLLAPPPRLAPLSRQPTQPTRPTRPTLGGSALARLGVVLALISAGVAIGPPVALGIGGGWWLHRWLGLRWRRMDAADALARALPDAVDLLILAASAGLELPVAHLLVARHAPAPVRPALLAADAAARAGQPRADALSTALGPLGERAQALAQVLGDHLRYGVPLLPALERIRLELALDRRRRAELAARRVPVQLLGPLVLCVLPAFGLLSVVPLLGASLRSLPS